MSGGFSVHFGSKQYKIVQNSTTGARTIAKPDALATAPRHPIPTAALIIRSGPPPPSPAPDRSNGRAHHVLDVATATGEPPRGSLLDGRCDFDRTAARRAGPGVDSRDGERLRPRPRRPRDRTDLRYGPDERRPGRREGAPTTGVRSAACPDGDPLRDGRSIQPGRSVLRDRSAQRRPSANAARHPSAARQSSTSQSGAPLVRKPSRTMVINTASIHHGI